MPAQEPTVGRVVHYVSYGTPGGEYPSVCRAAHVTEVGQDGSVSLCVLNPTGLFFNLDVPYSAGVPEPGAPGQGWITRYPGGTWHWPERV